jgi:hypothetical protein
MTPYALDEFLLHLALPPFKLGIRVQRLEARCKDRDTSAIAAAELQFAERSRSRLAREGWRN